MDWDKAIERNEIALLRIVSGLFALLVSARLASSGLFVPRRVWRSILLVLRPAEAAVRRLIIMAARALAPVALTLRQRAVPAPRLSVVRSPGAVPLAPVFLLADPLKYFGFSADDEASFADGKATSGSAVLGDEPVNAIPLHNRLRALRHALADLSKQAARLARFNARRDALLKAGRPTRISLMRPGLPPGWRERSRHEVDPVLRECHRLVQHLDDTS